MKTLLTILGILSLCFPVLSAELKLGITKTDAKKYSTEFEAYDDLAKFYGTNDIRATFLEYENFVHPGIKPEALAKELCQFNVVLLMPFDEGVRMLTPEKQAYAVQLGKVLADYVQAGGGLIIQPCPVRYPGNDDEKYWNIIFKTFDMEIAREGISDLSNMKTMENKLGFTNEFFYTGNVKKHPLTEGISGFWLPVRSYADYPGTVLMKYGKDWDVVVSGGKESATFINDEHLNYLDLKRPGTLNSNVPIMAVRNFGKGRIFSLPVHRIYTGDNLNKPTWSSITEEKGIEDKKSDMMKLMLNVVKYLGEPNSTNIEFGTFEFVPYRKVEFPERVSWDDVPFRAPMATMVRGIIGAHSNYSDGQSTVAEYVASAKAAGLDFIVFSDPLELLTKEKLEQLKADCKKYTADGFYVAPGVEFTDGSGIRRIFLGEKVVWPDETPFVMAGYSHQVWDGKVIVNYGKYLTQCAFCPSAIIDYTDLDKNNVRRENLWWFWNLIPYAYSNGKLIADNRKEYDFALADLRFVVPLPFTRISNANEVQSAADTAVLKAKSTAAVQNFTSNFASQRGPSESGMFSVSYGKNTPITISDWQITNNQMDPRVLQTRGVQRAIGKFKVESPNGIKEVKIFDRDSGIFRRFAGNGNVLEKQFELTHDQQHYLFLEVTDHAGNKALSHYLFVFDYKQGLYRCGDNLNILGSVGYWWHPDRNELLPLTKQLRTAEIFSVQGWDRAQADCPIPFGSQKNNMKIDNKGEVFPLNPELPMPAMRMQVKFAGGDMQIIDAVMDEKAEFFDNSKRPGPSWASPAKIIGKNEYFSHKQRFYAPRDRMNHHIAWDHRRLRESLQEYAGSLHYYTGEFEFQQNVTLQKGVAVPIVLGNLHLEPRQLSKKVDQTLLVKTVDGEILTKLFPKGDHSTVNGTIANDGYLTVFQSPIGYVAIFPLDQNQWDYQYNSNGVLEYGIGVPGKSYQAGEKIPYAYAAVTIVDETRDEKYMEQLAKLIRGDYPLEVKTGEKLPGNVLLQLKAENHQTAFSVGPANGFGVDLPVSVQGIEDNGCAAIFSTVRPYFRFVGVNREEQTAYFQEPMESKNEIWAGNVFVADNKDLKITLVADGQMPGKQPFLEIHNPTDKAIQTKVFSPKGTPKFGGKEFNVNIPEGASMIYSVSGKKFASK